MLPSLPRLAALPIISQPFKRSQEGLFHGKMIQYGNNVPHSKHKTRRTWLPNVRSKRLPLEATGETLKLKVTTRALRSIKKVCIVGPALHRDGPDVIVTRLVQAGGLDNYVMNTHSDLLGMEGMRLRILVRSRLEEEARLKEEADKMQRAKEKQERRDAYLQNASEAKRGDTGKASRANPSSKRTLSPSSPPS
jgi:large subunit ribosomal protein L28